MHEERDEEEKEERFESRDALQVDGDARLNSLEHVMLSLDQRLFGFVGFQDLLERRSRVGNKGKEAIAAGVAGDLLLTQRPAEAKGRLESAAPACLAAGTTTRFLTIEGLLDGRHLIIEPPCCPGRGQDSLDGLKHRGATPPA